MHKHILISLSLVSCAIVGCTDEPQPRSCSNQCSAGEGRCAGTIIMTCAADAYGCLIWMDQEDCSTTADDCDDSSGSPRCVVTTGACSDGVRGGSETDIDCGGDTCPPCAVGGDCVVSTDCVSNNCDIGNSDTCVTPDTPTCGDGAHNNGESDVDCGGENCPTCPNGSSCTDADDCTSGVCNDDVCEADEDCTLGENRCNDNVVEACVEAGWEPATVCPQGCSDGACSPAVACSAGETRCLGQVVQECNATQTAWGQLYVCADACNDGLCVGGCTPGSLRCNDDQQEKCNALGNAWVPEESCSLGCAHATCVEPAITNQGVPQIMDGVHVVDGCVVVELAGTIEVPAGETLEIYARCLQVSSSSAFVLGAGSTLVFRAAETIVNQGSIAGGSRVFLQAYQGLTNSGTIDSNEVVLRADVLVNDAGGTVSGASTFALWGTSWTSDGTFTGTSSVMPPERVTSSSHPSGSVWNMHEVDVSIAWDRPFTSALGYYVTVNGDLPTPANATFLVPESRTIPLAEFNPGENRVQIVTVAADSTVGIVPVAIDLELNVAPPTLTSSSHPSQTSWSDNPSVYLSWTDPTTAPATTWRGYIWELDHRGDTHPTWSSGTHRTEQSLLLADQPTGVWFFHLVNVDRLGRTSPVAAHYQFRIGPDPGNGNIAGTITDATTADPIAGARIEIDGGLLATVSTANGDYTFAGGVPAVDEPHEIEVSAPGYEAATATATVGAAQVEIRDFALQANQEPLVFDVGFEVMLSASNPGNADLSIGPAGRIILSRSSSVGGSLADEGIVVATTYGGVLYETSTWEEYYARGARTDVGYNGSHFYALDYYKCDDDGSMAFGHGWSCIRMHTYGPDGLPLDGWTAYRRSGHSGSPSGAWNGSTYGTFFVSYSAIVFRELDADVTFSNGGDEVDNTELECCYGDARQSARTNAVWDGTGYTVAWSIDDGSGTDTIYVARYALDLSPLLTPRVLDTTYLGPLSMVFDGNEVHVGYRKRATNPSEVDLYIRSIDTAGSLSDPTLVVGSTENASDTVSLAFDGRHLLCVYANDDVGFLEAREPADHGVVATRDLGPMVSPRIDYSTATGDGFVLFERPDVSGTYGRTLQTR